MKKSQKLILVSSIFISTTFSIQTFADNAAEKDLKSKNGMENMKVEVQPAPSSTQIPLKKVAKHGKNLNSGGAQPNKNDKGEKSATTDH